MFFGTIKRKFNDPDDRLTLELTTLEEGQKYELVVTPKLEVIRAKERLTGSVILETNSLKQPDMRIKYSIIPRP